VSKKLLRRTRQDIERKRIVGGNGLVHLACTITLHILPHRTKVNALKYTKESLFHVRT